MYVRMYVRMHVEIRTKYIQSSVLEYYVVFDFVNGFCGFCWVLISDIY